MMINKQNPGLTRRGFVAGAATAAVSSFFVSGSYAFGETTDSTAPEYRSEIKDAFSAALSQNGKVYFPFLHSFSTIEGYMRDWENERPDGQFSTDIFTLTATDIDGDGVLEILLGIKATGHDFITYCLVLDYKDKYKGVFAYELSGDAFRYLRKSGTFYSRSGSRQSICRLRLSDDAIDEAKSFPELIVPIISEDYSELDETEGCSGYHPAYYVGSSRVPNHQYQEMRMMINESAYADWYEAAKDGIVKVLGRL